MVGLGTWDEVTLQQSFKFLLPKKCLKTVKCYVSDDCGAEFSLKQHNSLEHLNSRIEIVMRK